MPRTLQPGRRTNSRNLSPQEHLERLVADIELLNDVRVQGLDGPAFAELVRALVEYGYQMIGSWIRTGAIFGKLAEKGVSHYLARYPKRIPSSVDATQMAQDVVADAVVKFRDHVIIPSKWEPAKGAALTTYFTGQCLLRFPQVYVEWLKTNKFNGMCVPPEDVLDPDAETSDISTDPAAVAVIRSRLRDARKTVPSRMTAILMLIEEGYSHPEIAHMLGTSVGAIESRLHRHHKKNSERTRLNDSP